MTTARIADARGDARECLAVLAAARGDIRSGGVAAEVEADALAARAHRRLGQLDAAIARGRRAAEGIERVRRSLGLGELRTAFVTDKARVYADLVLALLEADRTAEALEVADNARSRALIEHMAAARLHAGDTTSAEALLVERARVLQRIDALLSRLSATAAAAPRERSGSVTGGQSATVDELAAARREFDELLVRSPQPNGALATVDRSNTQTIRRALRADEALVEFFVIGDRTLIFVLRRDVVRAFTSSTNAEDLAGRVRLVRDLLGRAPTRDSGNVGADVVLRALHRTLIEPLVASGTLAGARQLIVVPHGALAYLPFAALRSSSGRPLVDDYALLYLPVAAALPALRASGSLPAAVPFVSLAPFPRALTSSGTEARRAADAHARSTTLLGGRATEAAMREALRSGAIVHVAFPRDDGDGKPDVFAHRVRSRDRCPARQRATRGARATGASGEQPARVSLGCETGVGVAWSSRYAQTDDHATLEQALLYAGARTVIATRWRIEDQSAAVFAALFYAHLGRNSHDVAEALASAQRDLRRDPRFNAPHYWAAYAVSGSGSLWIDGLVPGRGP